MAPVHGRLDKSPGRKRKAHTKSRGGCGNCKMRRVKCDEVKPFCRRCKTFGVACSYDRASSALQPHAEVAFLVDVDVPQMAPSTKTKTKTNQTVLAMLNDSLHRQDVKNRAFRLDTHDVEVLGRFRERAVVSIETEHKHSVYQREAVRLAFQLPFLLHMAVAMTIVHDREGTSQLNNVQSKPEKELGPAERDAIWITTVLPGCQSRARVETDAPEEVWPLKTPSPSDLDWLPISTGKRETWRMADLQRPESAFRHLAPRPIDGYLTAITDRDALAALPPELVAACGCDVHLHVHFAADDAPFPPHDNPYHQQLAVLGRLTALEPCAANLLRALTFLTLMPAAYRTLLERKDPRAMLVLLYFYAIATRFCQWWWHGRALLEGRAICIYLETYHADLPRLRDILSWPKRALGVGDWGLSRAMPGTVTLADAESEAEAEASFLWSSSGTMA